MEVLMNWKAVCYLLMTNRWHKQWVGGTDWPCLKNQYISLLPKHVTQIYRGVFLCAFVCANTVHLKVKLPNTNGNGRSRPKINCMFSLVQCTYMGLFNCLAISLSEVMYAIEIIHRKGWWHCPYQRASQLINGSYMKFQVLMVQRHFLEVMPCALCKW